MNSSAQKFSQIYTLININHSYIEFYNNFSSYNSLTKFWDVTPHGVFGKYLSLKNIRVDDHKLNLLIIRDWLRLGTSTSLRCSSSCSSTLPYSYTSRAMLCKQARIFPTFTLTEKLVGHLLIIDLDPIMIQIIYEYGVVELLSTRLIDLE